MRRAVIFNYNSVFAPDIEKTILEYNNLYPANRFGVYMCGPAEYPSESMAGPADVIIHSGGDGSPVEEDAGNTPKLYICHSHEWKCVKEGGRLGRLSGALKGVREIDVLEDDEILGKKGKMRIMKYHELAVFKAPPSARVLAVSRAVNIDKEETEIIEALRYPDGSISVQGHPEEGAAAHIFHNFFNTALKRRMALSSWNSMKGYILHR